MTEHPHPVDNLLVKVALGHADSSARDRVAAHLGTCAACREKYLELADAVELTLPAVPRVSPPPGFEAAVLARLDRERRGGAVAEVSRQQPRRRARWLAVAAGVVGLAAGTGLGAQLVEPEAEPPSARVTWGTSLVTADGAEVGTVAPSRDASGPVLVIDITDGPPGHRYTCRLVLTDGTRQDIAQWQLTADRANSWVVRVPDPGVVSVEMVAESGSVWSTAGL